MTDIVALGEALIDFTYNGLSKDGQKLFEQNAGGAPCNLLASANKCGLKTAFIGKVGNDMHGLFLKQTMRNAGIETKNLIVSDNYFTTLAFVGISETGERNFSFSRKNSADIMLDPTEVDEDLIKTSKIFHIGSLSLTNEPAKSATMHAINIAKLNNVIVSYDPNYRASLWPNENAAITAMRSLIPFVNIMKISDEESHLLTGESDPVLAGKALNSLGVDIVCVTLGDKGVWVSQKGIGILVDGFRPSTVCDTTGAGDSFFGGFLSEFIKQKATLSTVTLDKLAEFARFGNAVASLCIEKRGGIPAMPDLDKVLERYGKTD